MSGTTTLWLMGALIGIVALIIYAALRASSRAGAAEAEAESNRSIAEAIAGSAKADRETMGRMADVDAASVADTAERARERMRKRLASTR